MKLKKRVPIILTQLVLAFIVSCGDSGYDEYSDEPENTYQDAYMDTAIQTQEDTTTYDTAPEIPFIPEQETFFQPPQSSHNYVFIANTKLDTVAKIDSQTLEITSIEVGDKPTAVATVADRDLAIVLNQGSDEVSIIRAAPNDDSVLNLEILPAMNTLTLSPSGNHLIAWYNDRIAETDDRVGPFQDISVVDLEEDEEQVYNISVGFHIIEIEFNAQGTHAFVITDDGLNILDLTTLDRDAIIPSMPLALDPLIDIVDREVEITSNGEFAFIRNSTDASLLVADLKDRSLNPIPLPGIPTDLDLFPEADWALVVMRDVWKIALIPIPTGITDPESVEIIDVPEENSIGVAVLTATADKAIIYSSIAEQDRLLILSIPSRTLDIYRVRKGIRTVAMSPDGNKILIFHNKQPGTPIPGEDPDAFIAKSWAYSLFDIETGFSKLVTIDTEAGAFSFSPDNRKAFLLQNDDELLIKNVDVIDLSSFSTETLELGSPPEHVGIIEGANKVYVAQEHEVGRMSFIDLITGELKTVTGYELNSRID